MSPLVSTACPVCETRMEVPYILLGAEASCPCCGKSVVPVVPVGTTYPNTAYQITFSDFQQLIKSDYRFGIKKLLSEWYGYEIVASNDSVTVRSHDCEAVDLLELHRRIQSEYPKQRAIYNAAMALWR